MDHDIHARELALDVPDFTRNLHCLFGLPFDVVSVEEAVDGVLAAVQSKRRCVLSTPNLNILVASRQDADFRAALIRSNLCVVDGMPLVWAGRWLGVPFRERVAGSGLFERLRNRPADARPLKVYLFGGGDGVAARAAKVLNAESGGVQCVGYASPGFGDVASMSTPEILDAINASGADFVLVALGAKKGQAWIEHNRPHLTAPVVSYLGAVINFIAGTVRRAPEWMQRSGLEWLWRIVEEHGLARRYGHDGLRALGLVLTNVLPNLATWHLARLHHGCDAPAVDGSAQEDGVVISLRGAWTKPALPLLRPLLMQHANSGKHLHLDMSAVSYVDSALVAVLLVLRQHRLDRGTGFSVDAPSPTLRAIFKMYCAVEMVENQ